MQFTSLLLLVLLSLVHKCVSLNDVLPETDTGQLYHCSRLGQTCGPGECSDGGVCKCPGPADKAYLYGCQEIKSTACTNPCEADQECLSSDACTCKSSNFVLESTECVPRVKLTCKNNGFEVKYTPHSVNVDFGTNGRLSLKGETGCFSADPSTKTLTVSDYSQCATPELLTGTPAGGITTRVANLIMQFNKLIVSKYDIRMTLECTEFADGGVSGSTKVLSPGVTGSLDDLTTGTLESQYVVQTTAHTPLNDAPVTTFGLGDPAVLKFSFIAPAETVYAKYTVLSCWGFPAKPFQEADGYEFYKLCGGAQNELIIDKPQTDTLLDPSNPNVDTKVQFLKFVSFKITEDNNELFIRCDLKLCPTGAGAAACEIAPLSPSTDYCGSPNRKKREASGPITGLNGNTTEVTFTSTVIQFKDGNSESEMKYHDDDEDDHVDSTTFVVTVAVLGTLLLICYILISLLIRAAWCKDPGYKSESRDDLRPFPPGYACHVPRVETGKY